MKIGEFARLDYLGSYTDGEAQGKVGRCRRGVCAAKSVDAGE